LVTNLSADFLPAAKTNNENSPFLFCILFKVKFLLFTILLFSLPIASQSIEKTSSEPLAAERFLGYDSYGNVLYVQDMVIRKKGPLGNFEFRDYQLGPISSVDIKNPLNTLVFYEESNVVLFLDNRMNEVERINFNEVQGFPLVTKAENAGNNRIWLFDMNTQQLELYDYRSEQLTPISQPISEEILDLASDFNYCYVLTESSIKKYNVYASFLSEEPHEEFTRIYMLNNQVIGLSDTGIFMTKWSEDVMEQRFKPVKIPLSENPVKDLQLTQDFLYIYNGLDIQAFSIAQPKQ